MPRKKSPPKIIHRKVDDHEKHLAMGSTIYSTLEGMGSIGVSARFAKLDKGFLAKLGLAIVTALREVEEIERRPGEQWQGTNVQRSAV